MVTMVSTMHSFSVIFLVLLSHCLWQLGQTAQCPCVNPSFNPVCGSLSGREKTYLSRCQLECAQEMHPGLILVHPGPCCRKLCFEESKPVCDSKGITHPNECLFYYAKCKAQRLGSDIAIANEGPCLTFQHDPVKPANRFPQTGAPTNAFISALAGPPNPPSPLREEPVTSIRRMTKCSKDACAGLSRNPVCDSTGAIHQNTCRFNYANCLEMAAGRPNLLLVACPETINSETIENIARHAQPSSNNFDVDCEDPDFECEDVYLPVCGSDDVTYDNMCHMKLANCQTDERLTVIMIKHGPCENLGDQKHPKWTGQPRTEPVPIQCVDRCPKDYHPVCGSDDKTYSSRCDLDFQNCLLSKVGVDPLAVIHMGPCHPKPSFAPAGIDDIAEASNETTFEIPDENDDVNDFSVDYDSSSELHESMDPNLRNKSMDMMLANMNCPTVCPDILSPVCDQEGKHFPNKCIFDRENCKRKASRKSLLRIKPCPGLSNQDLIPDKVTPPPTGTNPCQFGCPRIFAPVCDANGDTHSNRCMFDYHNCVRAKMGRDKIALEYHGPCGRPIPTKIPKTYIPRDVARRGSLTTPPPLPPRTPSPVTIKPKPSSANVEPSTRVPQSESDCDFSCAKIYSPVCDSEEKTHPNLCQFDQAVCLAKFRGEESPKLQKHGACGDEQGEPIQLLAGGLRGSNTCQFQCTKMQNPVCDSQGKTHANMCTFEFNKCVAEAAAVTLGRPMTELNIVFEDSCDNPPPTTRAPFAMVHAENIFANIDCPSPDACDSAASPVCDSRGNSHLNKCQFDAAKCIAKKIKGLTVDVAHNGPCPGTSGVNDLLDLNGIAATSTFLSSTSTANTTIIATATKASTQVATTLLTSTTPPSTIAVASSIAASTITSTTASTIVSTIASTSASTIVSITVPITKLVAPSTTAGATIQVSPNKIISNEPKPIVLGIKPNLTEPDQDSNDEEALDVNQLALSLGEPVAVVVKPDREFEVTHEPCNFNCQSSSTEEPVCDVTGTEYASFCIFREADCRLQLASNFTLKLSSFAPCQENFTYSLEYKDASTLCDPVNCARHPLDEPVCDSEGATYSGLCSFYHKMCTNLHRDSTGKNESINILPTLIHKGFCSVPSDEQTCDTFCDDVAPYNTVVCDTKGRTHSSVCLFNSAKCQAAKNGYVLDIAHLGDCMNNTSYKNSWMDCDKLNCSQVSSSYDTSLCDSAGVHYDSLCEFYRNRCDSHNNTVDSDMAMMMIREFGECSTGEVSDPCDYICEEEMGDQICDSVGVTHRNLCKFKLARCQQSLMHNNESTLVLVHFAACVPDIDYPSINTCSKVCTGELDPICDNRGVTHDNVCLFNYAACTENVTEVDQPLDIAFRGRCEGSINVMEVDKKNIDLSIDPNGTPLSDGIVFSSVLDGPPRVFIKPDPVIRLVPKTPSQPSNDALVKSPTDEICRLSCPNVTIHVCDNLNNTYLNPCIFNYAACTRRNAEREPIFLNHAGECTPNTKVFTHNTEVCPLNCPSSSEHVMPICDNEGRTHDNFCHFRQSDCQRRQAGHATPLSIAALGPCEKAALTLGGGLAVEVDPKDDGPFELSEAEIQALIQSTLEATPQQPQVVSVPRTRTRARQNSVGGAAVECNQECNSDDYNPVCDNHGKTHANPCFYEYASCAANQMTGKTLVIVRNGPCESQDLTVVTAPPVICDSECSDIKRPVCDSRNMTHMNLCQFEYYNCEMNRNGQPTSTLTNFGVCGSPEATDGLDCPDPHCSLQKNRPVCDNKGNTHANPCFFNHARCQKRRQSGEFLKISYYGECLPTNCDSLTCQPEEIGSGEICDSSFRTHDSLCDFKKQQCQARKKGATISEVLFLGVCSECIRNCSDAPDAPVCSSMDQTFSNKCEFEVASCIFGKQFDQKITIDYAGECCNKDCEFVGGANSSGVCDSRGVTHLNRCLFSVDQCLMSNKFNKEIFIEFETECKSGDTDELMNNFEFELKPGTRIFRGGSGALKNCARNCDAALDEAAMPVCGSDMVTYRSRCELEKKQCLVNNTLTINHEGPCCSDSVTKCPSYYKPVCDSAKATHANKCLFHAVRCEVEKHDGQKLKIVYEGECCDRVCPNTWSPVCDDHGGSHVNLCYFGHARCLAQRSLNVTLELASYGVCRRSTCHKNCSDEYNPVCGSDGQTYPSKCRLDTAACLVAKVQKSLSVVYEGSCCSDDCPYSYDPVCDSEGTTHVNLCRLEHQKCVLDRKFSRNSTLTLVNRGPCCKQVCTGDRNPVCDSKGTTHDNLCAFRVAQCEAEHRGEGLTIEYYAECCKMRHTCPPVGEPVCGSDGKSYANRCQLDFQACTLERRTNETVSLEYEGNCCTLQSCHNDLQPLCDSLGKTHDNLCKFKVSKCIHERMNENSTLEISYEGSCCDRDCAGQDDAKKVCDQHGKTYANRCEFDVAVCRKNKMSEQMLLLTPCATRRTVY